MPPIRIAIEGRLAFEFDSQSWVAVKWDDEVSYHQGLRRLDATAVDILATQHRAEVYLIEVKDPRGHWTEYRDNNPNEKLADIVASKVRDTVSGLVYARDRVPGAHLDLHLKSLFHGRKVRPSVIFWLEGDDVAPALATTLTGLIERRLRWLNPKVIVTSRRLWRGLSGLTVRSLAGAPWTG